MTICFCRGTIYSKSWDDWGGAARDDDGLSHIWNNRYSSQKLHRYSYAFLTHLDFLEMRQVKDVPRVKARRNEEIFEQSVRPVALANSALSMKIHLVLIRPSCLGEAQTLIGRAILGLVGADGS